MPYKGGFIRLVPLDSPTAPGIGQKVCIGLFRSPVQNKHDPLGQLSTYSCVRFHLAPVRFNHNAVTVLYRNSRSTTVATKSTVGKDSSTSFAISYFGPLEFLLHVMIGLGAVSDLPVGPFCRA